jgi:hypothetical protein
MKKRQEFSVHRKSWRVRDKTTGKPRLHWDYRAAEWRSGYDSSIKLCPVCDQQYIAGSRAKMCDPCDEVLRRERAAYWKLQQTAAARLAKAIRQREILHPTAYTCVDCGQPAECYDHRDYTKPLDVAPVCKACNVNRGHAVNLPPHLRVVHRKGNERVPFPHPELKRLVREKLVQIAEDSR